MKIITESQHAEYLQGIFYHGTALDKPNGFRGTAYFTQTRAEATEYAWMDSEVDGDPPTLFAVRLHCSNPAIIDWQLMQDLAQTQEGRDKAQELISQGHDVVLGDMHGLDEVCVLDPSKIEIVEVIPLPYRDGTWPQVQP